MAWLLDSEQRPIAMTSKMNLNLTSEKTNSPINGEKAEQLKPLQGSQTHRLIQIMLR